MSFELFELFTNSHSNFRYNLLYVYKSEFSGILTVNTSNVVSTVDKVFVSLTFTMLNFILSNL